MNTTPKIATDEDVRRLARLIDAARDIARHAPARHGSTTTHALIYWPRVDELRGALDAMGIEWGPGQ